MIIIAIDPGIRETGIMVYDSSARRVLYKKEWRNDRDRGQLDCILALKKRLASFLTTWFEKDSVIDVIIIEDILPFGARKGVFANAKLVGALTAIASSWTDVHLISPREWKRWAQKNLSGKEFENPHIQDAYGIARYWSFTS